ncbi:hypothetical protein [Microbacterium sp.]|uniref:hypothetical protein n=1 Tax=Microbacterium sp. TaxID=51671 RepID=UPI00262EC00D|nr:hypothetical protein [Microbacterium sp.]
MVAEIARGLADLQVAPLTGAGDTPGAWVDVPGARSLSFNVESDSDELEGDNEIIAKVRNPKSLTGSIEIGRINLAALAVMLGGQVETGGVSGVTKLDELAGSDISFYAIAGQAPGVDVSGSAYRVVIPKALTTSGLDETMEVNAWNTPTLDFEGLAVDGILLTREQYEDASDIPTS